MYVCVHKVNVRGLMKELGIHHVSQEWRLIIDFSKVSLLAVLLHNRNENLSLPFVHSVTVKESYDNMLRVLADTN